MVELRLPRYEQHVDDDARGVEHKRLVDSVLDELAEEVLAAHAPAPIDVRDVGTEHQRGLRPAPSLEQRRLAGRKLDRIRLRLDERLDRAFHVLDPGEERGLTEEAVVDRDVEATAVGGEEPVEPDVHAGTALLLIAA